ncbi:hypothetical protein KP509_1Z178400 [Ceratopteris richardii]|nr:hypothetical protein KP509_1Z178400 [Ceratopteris richardii]
MKEKEAASSRVSSDPDTEIEGFLPRSLNLSVPSTSIKTPRVLEVDKPEEKSIGSSKGVKIVEEHIESEVRDECKEVEPDKEVEEDIEEEKESDLKIDQVPIYEEAEEDEKIEEEKQIELKQLDLSYGLERILKDIRSACMATESEFIKGSRVIEEQKKEKEKMSEQIKEIQEKNDSLLESLFNMEAQEVQNQNKIKFLEEKCAKQTEHITKVEGELKRMETKYKILQNSYQIMVRANEKIKNQATSVDQEDLERLQKGVQRLQGELKETKDMEKQASRHVATTMRGYNKLYHDIAKEREEWKSEKELLHS